MGFTLFVRDKERNLGWMVRVISYLAGMFEVLQDISGDVRRARLDVWLPAQDRGVD